MRTSLVTIALSSVLGSVVPFLASGTPSGAQERLYPYCLVEHSSLTTPSYQCYYTSFQQCVASASGRSATCHENPELQARAQSKTKPRSR